jgi:DeoR/GlpR family transcriptional regulator of sugar metabolism
LSKKIKLQKLCKLKSSILVEKERNPNHIGCSVKIGKVSFASLGGLDLIHSFITDDCIADEDRRRFEDMGIKVILAK